MVDEERGNWRLRDFAATAGLLIAQAVLWRATLDMTRSAPTLLPNLGLYLLLATIAVAVVVMARQRPGLRIAIGGCVLQLLLILMGVSA